MSNPNLESLARWHYLSLLARRGGGRSLLAGTKRKLLTGGTEAVGLRDYAPGDDCRYVDWHLCARRDEMLSKTFDCVEDTHTYILLDCSPSMGLGSPPKFDLARRIAAALSYATLAAGDCLTPAAFAGRIVAELPPLRGRAKIGLALRFWRKLALQGDRTDLAATAEAFARRYQRHGPVLVISDLYDTAGFPRAFDILRDRGYEPRLVQIHAGGEADPGLLGDVELCDVESQSARRVTITKRAAERYRTLFAQFRAAVRDYCRKHAIPAMQIGCDAAEDEVLLRALCGK